MNYLLNNSYEHRYFAKQDGLEKRIGKIKIFLGVLEELESPSDLSKFVMHEMKKDLNYFQSQLDNYKINN